MIFSELIIFLKPLLVYTLIQFYFFIYHEQPITLSCTNFIIIQIDLSVPSRYELYQKFTIFGNAVPLKKSFLHYSQIKSFN